MSTTTPKADLAVPQSPNRDTELSRGTLPPHPRDRLHLPVIHSPSAPFAVNQRKLREPCRTAAGRAI